MDNWLVYIVRCCDDSFYTGATNNLTKRLKAHSDAKGAKYTASRRPISLVGHSMLMSKSQALKLEYKVKQQKRKDKINFLREHEK